MNKNIKYALLAFALLQVSTVKGSANVSEVQIIDFERLKTLATERYFNDVEESYRRIMRIGALAKKKNAPEQGLTSQESEEYAALEAGFSLDEMELYARAGINTDSITAEQWQEMKRIISEVLSAVIVNYRQNHPIAEVARNHEVSDEAFEELKRLFEQRYLANQEERYHQIIRVRELLLRSAVQLITPEEVEEYHAWQARTREETLELFTEAGIDPEAITKDQGQEILHFIAQLGKQVVSNYQETHAISIDFERFKALVAERYQENQEDRYPKIMRLRELTAKLNAQQISSAEVEEFNSLVIGAQRELVELYAQAGINPGLVSDEQSQELISFMAQLTNVIVEDYQQSHPIAIVADEDLLQPQPSDLVVNNLEMSRFANLKQHAIDFYSDKVEMLSRRASRILELGAKNSAHESTQEEAEEHLSLLLDYNNELQALLEQAGLTQESLTEGQRQELFAAINQLANPNSAPVQNVEEQQPLPPVVQDFGPEFEAIKQHVINYNTVQFEARVALMKRILAFQPKTEQRLSEHEIEEFNALEIAFDNEMESTFRSIGVDPEALPSDQQDVLKGIFAQHVAEITRASLPVLPPGFTYLLADQLQDQIVSSLLDNSDANADSSNGISEIKDEEQEEVPNPEIPVIDETLNENALSSGQEKKEQVVSSINLQTTSAPVIIDVSTTSIDKTVSIEAPVHSTTSIDKTAAIEAPVNQSPWSMPFIVLGVLGFVALVSMAILLYKKRSARNSEMN